MSQDFGEHTIGLPVFDLFPNYRDLLTIDLSNWNLAENRQRLLKYAGSYDAVVLRVLAMNETVPEYILAQLWQDEDDATRELVRHNKNFPAWLKR